MNTRSLLLPVLLVAGAAGVVHAWRAGEASAQPKAAPSAYAAASVSPSNLPPEEEAAPLASGQRPMHLPDLTVPPPPETPSEKPALSEWAKAPHAPEVRITDPGCKAQRIREWYRVNCRDEQVSVIAGKKTDLDIHQHVEEGASVVFPARRGETRLLTFAFLWKWGFVQDAVLSVQWLEGDERPLITLVGIPHGGI